MYGGCPSPRFGLDIMDINTFTFFFKMKLAVLYYIVVYQIQFLKNDCHLGDDPPHEKKTPT